MRTSTVLADLHVRPLFAALGALMTGIVAAPAVVVLPFFVLAAATLLAGGVALVLKGRPAWLVGALCVTLLLVGVLRTRLATTPLPGDVSRFIDGQGLASRRVRGSVATDIDVRPRDRIAFTLSVTSVDDYALVRPAFGHLRVTAPRPRVPLGYGDVVELRGRLTKPPGATNPGGFDYAAFLARRGVWATLAARRASDVRVIAPGGGSWPGRAAAYLRTLVQTATGRHLAPGDAALMNGLLLSIRGSLSVDVVDAFSRTGAVHVLSTSGMHLGVLAATLTAVSGLLGGALLPRAATSLLIALLIWVYALAAGAGPAVIRSAVMLSVVLAAPLVRREPDGLSALGAAAFGILLYQPLALYDAGTQLSFATVATLLCWMPLAERMVWPWEPDLTRRARAMRVVVLAFVVGVIAQAGSWPLVAYHFNLFSLVAPIAGPPIGALSGMLLILGLGCVALGWAPAALGGWLFWPLAGGGLAVLRWLALAFGAPSWAAVSVVSPPVALILVYYLLVGGSAPFVREMVLRKTLFAPDPAAAVGGGGNSLVGDPAQTEPGHPASHVSGCGPG